MHKEERIIMPEVTLGEVQKKVRDWEIHIIALTAEKDLKEMCRVYFSIGESSLKEDLRLKIINANRLGHAPETKLLPADAEACALVPLSVEDAQEDSGLLNTAQSAADSPCVQEQPLGSPGAQEEDTHGASLACIQEENTKAKMFLASELRKQLAEKHIYIVDAQELEKMEWQDIISYLLDAIKSLGYMRPALQKKPKSRMVCFNCNKKGHIVKSCPERAKEHKRR
ncbi:uncharacterized protein NEMAJ01_1290 [Nematocida major]|uniref:uncharacterized protein n=1 Tax=Nematocida major TaxID=1912982 RepID=UPI0020087132|nr:uncharacterized protein NEMAJ01_1290 [Nematocida major]KAH9386394.1 hypothetical protein NEMAJ01_1290 [Nematocida major]